MSEQAKYNVTRKDLNNIRAATLLPYNEGWEQPTFEEVRAVIALAGQHIGKEKLTGKQIANLVGVNPRNVRKWTAPPETSNHIAMPYAAWRLLVIFCGIEKNITIDMLDQVAE